MDQTGSQAESTGWHTICFVFAESSVIDGKLQLFEFVVIRIVYRDKRRASLINRLDLLANERAYLEMVCIDYEIVRRTSDKSTHISPVSGFQNVSY